MFAAVAEVSVWVIFKNDEVVFFRYFKQLRAAFPGHHAMTAILDRRLPIDALVTASDRLAVGAYQALHERGVAVPDNLAVVSFDDSAQAAQLTPPLSSIRPHSYEMGRAAVRLAIERLIDRRTVAEQVILPSCLVERASSAPRSK